MYYASARTLSLAGLQGVINDTEHDAVYLNSFLSPRLTVLPLLLRRLGRVPRKPWILAPRGEFAPAALAAKALKKRAYLLAAKAAGLYRDLTWQASAQHEADDIRSVFGSIAKRVLIAPDLPRAPPDVGEEGSSRPGGTATGPLRLIFLSRLAPVKNLDFLLDILATVRCEVDLAIHGLKENEAYWQSCEERIAALPGNVRASYHGAVMPDDVPGTFAQYDLFAFPSRGENFGHVVLESLSVGTPVLVSDRTPWKGGESDALEVLPIERREPWRDAIERWGSMTDAERRAPRGRAWFRARLHPSSRGSRCEPRAVPERHELDAMNSTS